jgi:hypothetical protein
MARKMITLNLTGDEANTLRKLLWAAYDKVDAESKRAVFEFLAQIDGPHRRTITSVRLSGAGNPE